MQKITPNQNKRLHQLLAMTGLKEEKKALVLEYTRGRSDSSREMLMAEAQGLIDHLENSLKTPEPSLQKEIEADKMRRKILSLSHELRWHLPGTSKLDMKRVNDWCQQRGFGKKLLNDYTHAELTKLVSQLKIVYRKFLENLTK
jgi:hypothetical protein